MEPTTDQSLEDLQTCCDQELARYRRGSTGQESVCCLEIVRRAATTPDDATFAALLHMSRPLILQRCPAALRPMHDDLVQEVATRLFRKFHRGDQLFQVTTFAAYRVYLQLTCVSAAHTVRTQQSAAESLDTLHAATGFEPAAPLPTDAVERRMLLDRWLDLLPDPRQRAVFHHRFVLDEPPEAIAQALGITKKEVYRLVEQAIRVLKDIPEVREMLEA